MNTDLKHKEKKKPLTTVGIRKMKEQHIPIAMLTVYDYPSAKLAEEAGVDILFVGDSLGMVVLGYDSTIPVTMADMLHHTKAVSRAANHAFVLADMPFLTYYNTQTALENAGRLMQEGGARAVKMEGGREIAEQVEACVKAGIPVMGHIGLTPQSVHQLGGYKVRGKQPKEAQKLLDDAKALEQAGAFAVVLELIPEPLAAQITEQLSIPTIGIGAGRYCDGQVLVFHDLLQYASPVQTKFVKTYEQIGERIRQGVASYVQDVKERRFPEERHAFFAVDANQEGRGIHASH